MAICRKILGWTLLMLVYATPAVAVELGPLLETLQSVGPMGAGNQEASRAWRQLVQADADQLPVLLVAMDDAGPLADNWIRTAVDTVAERQLQRGGSLPVDALESLVQDTRHDPRARRVAFEWLVRVDPDARARLLADMLDDPDLELRYDAVALRAAEAERAAESGDSDKAARRFRQAFDAARDSDQISQLAKQLDKLGQKPDLTRHYGYVLRWKLIGPFDNTDESGFDVAYPPEQRIDFKASCPGKHGPVRWVDHTTTHPMGSVDLNKILGKEKGVIGYAVCEFFSEKRQKVEIRLTSASAIKLWLGETLLGEHKIYHGGAPMDQYVSRATLEPGRNIIRVKICQNEQTQDWARVWNIRLRVCDSLGGAVLSTDRDRE